MISDIKKTVAVLLAGIMLSSMTILGNGIMPFAAGATVPVVTINQPAAGQTISGTAIISAAVTYASGLSYVEFKADGGTQYYNKQFFPVFVPSTYQSALPTWALSNGPHTVFVTGTGTDGTKGTASVSVNVYNADSTLPTVSITQPLSGQKLNNPSVIMKGKASDIGTAVQGVGVSIDGGAFVAATTFDKFTGDWSFTTPTLANGAHTLTARATDSAFNTGQLSMTITIDTVKPTISITSPMQSQTITTSTISMVGTSSDIGTGVKSVEVRVDSGSYSPANLNAATGSWSYTTPALANGLHTLTARVFDNANNYGQQSIGVTVSVASADTTPPIVSTTSPANGVTVSGTISVTATASDTGSGMSKVEFYVDGVLKSTDTTPPSPYSFSLDTRTVSDGSHAIRADAFDVANNKASSQISVTVLNAVADTTKPIVTPPPNQTVQAVSASGRSVTYPSATATDNIDGSLSAICTPPSGSTFPLGTTTLTCSATDSAGNTGIATFTITVIDTTAPTLSIPSGITVEATSTSGRIVTFTATATDLVDGSRPVTCIPPSGSTFPLGITTVNCSASDTRGNTRTGSFTVTVRDTTNPTVSITSPSDGSLASGMVTVSAIATDQVAMSNVKLYVDGVYKGMDAGYPYSFSVDTSAYSNGAHTLQVKGWDIANNMGSSQIVDVNVQNGPPAGDSIDPTVSITSPADGSTITGTYVTVSVSASDASGIKRVEIFVDGKLKTALTGAGPAYDYSLNIKKLRTGDHIIQAIAYDIHENTASDSIGVTKVRR